MRIPVYFACYGRTGKESVIASEFDEASGELIQTGRIETMLNPSYVNFDQTKRFFFSVMQEESRRGYVRSYSAEEGFRPICDVYSGGDGPCYVAVSPSNRYVSVCNFPTGSFSAHKLDETGRMTPVAAVQHVGSGPNEARQAGPHAHSTVWSPWLEDVVYVCDLGCDRVFYYHVTDDAVTKMGEVTAVPGSGPRHLIFEEKLHRAYLLGEMGSDVTVFEVLQDGSFRQLQHISMLPEGFEGQTTAADLHMSSDRKFLYASNRGHDSIVCYRVDENGLLSDPVWTDSQGKIPRGFILSPSEKWLLCANQFSGNVIVFARDPEIGALDARHVYEGYTGASNIRF